MITILKKAARHHAEGKAFTTIIREMSDAEYELVAHKYKFEEYGRRIDSLNPKSIFTSIIARF